MSLSEIKKYITERSPRHMAELYEEQKILLDRKIVQLKQIKNVSIIKNRK